MLLYRARTKPSSGSILDLSRGMSPGEKAPKEKFSHELGRHGVIKKIKAFLGAEKECQGLGEPV